MKEYKVWIKRGTEKKWFTYRSELEPGQLYYHLKKYPRVEVGNGVFNVLQWESYWIEEIN